MPKLGDKRAILYGLMMYGLGFFLFAYATKSWMMYLFMVPFGLGGIAGPALQSMITQQVGPDAQGELQGGLTSLQSITTILGPLVASNMFAYFTSSAAPIQFPGAAFFIAGILVFIGLAIVLSSITSRKRI